MDRLSRRRRLSGGECAELVDLYVAASSDLAVLHAEAPDPAISSWLSQRVFHARAVITSPRDGLRDDFVRFVTRSFPLVLYRARWWWLGVAVGFLIVSVALGIWVASDQAVQQALLPDEEVRGLVTHDFADYYTANPATSFAVEVWTNNAWAAAGALVFGTLFVLPAVWVLWQNALNVGIVGGLMAANGRLDLFFGLISPHGLLELTAVFAAAAVGMRVGWAIIAPGPRPRAVAAAQEGRSAMVVAVGLVGVLIVAGVIEAFVTPSALPTWARIGIGFAAWSIFIGYVWAFGRAAEAAGWTADLSDPADASPYPPYVG